MTPKEQITDHHILWPRRSYKSSYEQKTRNYPGLVVRVPYGIQQELHNSTLPPPKPTRRQLRGLREHLDATHPDIIENCALWGVHRAIDYFQVDAINPDNKDRERTREITANLVTQLGHLACES